MHGGCGGFGGPGLVGTLLSTDPSHWLHGAAREAGKCSLAVCSVRQRAEFGDCSVSLCQRQ